MIRPFVALCTFLMGAMAFAQNQEDMSRSIANEACDCVSAKKLSSMTKDELETAIAACTLERAVSNNLDLDFSDTNAMLKFRTEVRLSMMNICPEIFVDNPNQVLMAGLSFDQDSEDMYKSIANETCDCVSAKKLSSMTKDELETAIAACTLERTVSNNINLNFSDTNAMLKFRTGVRLSMMNICPEVFAYNPNPVSDRFTDQVTGHVKSVRSSHVIVITLKDDTGRNHDLVWLRYFSGSEHFSANPKSMVGKIVTMRYQTAEFFSPRTGSYYKAKEITGLIIH